MEPRMIALAMLLVLPALAAAALIWLQYLNFSTRHWLKANGRILSSASQAREVHGREFHTLGSDAHSGSSVQETIATRNFATLSYEFKAGEKTYRGSRVDLGADSGNFEVAKTLRKYPAGKVVPVFYDPRDPSQCALEKLDPGMIRVGWLATLGLIALIFAGVFGVDRLAGFAEATISRPGNTPLVIVCALFALVVAGFARVTQKKGREMKTWPQTPGSIVESTVAATMRRVDSEGGSRSRVETVYVPRVVYQYSVGTDAFRGDNVGAAPSGGSPAAPTKFLARFPLNAPVAVFYDPADPTQSTLTPSVGYMPLALWTLASVFVFAGLAIAGFVPYL